MGGPGRRRAAPARVALPDGFLYRAGFLNEEEEAALLRQIAALEFAAFDYLGFVAKRRVVEYGWEYDFTSRRTGPAPPLPAFLQPLKRRAAALAGVAPEEIVEAVITEYPPGAPIGWHRDVPQFEKVIGVSLKSPCRMRFKPWRAEGKPVAAVLEPRSAYVLAGDARWRWRHSIPAVKELRYSITFRTLRGGVSGRE